MTPAMTPAEIIRRLELEPHPEGGHFAETYRDRPASGGRGALSCIYFLLQAGEASAWHRVDAAEVWHFAASDPLALTLSPDGRRTEEHRIGPDPLADDEAHLIVPAQCWQTAWTLGAWTLVSCIVAPAFEFKGFELAPPGWQPG